MRTLRYFVIPLISSIFTSGWWAYGYGLIENKAAATALILSSIVYGIALFFIIGNDIVDMEED